ncbi:MAG: ABC transporter ATP-binding protein [Firmicutes bacterium]|nr:ABC transporter ATP-binding protein [Bacillota bacterium]
MSVINAADLHKKYKKTEAVQGISFEVDKGEIFGFLGPNGAGKTTTIRILTTQIKPDKGKAEVLGFDVRKDSHKVKSRIGVVFEDQNLYPRLSVFQNLLFFARLYGFGKERVEEVLDFVELSHRSKDEAQKLSRGLKQRLIIARSLLTDPEIIFMDEPTSGLDPHIARNIRSLIRNLSEKGKTIFLTTHYMEEADELCSRIAIINKGKIVKLDTPENLKESIGKTSLVIKTENGTPGNWESRTMPADSPETAGALQELINKGVKFKIETKKPSLEDVFIALTGAKFE